MFQHVGLVWLKGGLRFGQENRILKGGQKGVKRGVKRGSKRGQNLGCLRGVRIGSLGGNLKRQDKHEWQWMSLKIHVS